MGRCCGVILPVVTLTEVPMLMIALLVSSSLVSFSLLVLIDQMYFGIPWTIAAPRALIATILGHWIALLWLYRLSKGKG